MRLRIRGPRMAIVGLCRTRLVVMVTVFMRDSGGSWDAVCMEGFEWKKKEKGLGRFVNLTVQQIPSGRDRSARKGQIGRLPHRLSGGREKKKTFLFSGNWTRGFLLLSLSSHYFYLFTYTFPSASVARALTSARFVPEHALLFYHDRLP